MVSLQSHIIYLNDVGKASTAIAIEIPPDMFRKAIKIEDSTVTAIVFFAKYIKIQHTPAMNDKVPKKEKTNSIDTN